MSLFRRACLLLTVLVVPAPALAASLTVSVLYFDNVTGDPAYDVLRKGLADMIITDLVPIEGVRIVERSKLQAVLDEQSLQNSKFFDPATAVKTGKLVGASHVVTGVIHAVAPRLRLDIRLIDVKKGTVLATSQVSGPKEDLFELEQQLVKNFVTTLRLNKQLPEVASGRTSADSLLAFSKGLDQSDQGDVKSAQATMAAVMQSAPGFNLAKTRYAELLTRVEKASETRDTALTGDEEILERQIAAWTARPILTFKIGEDTKQAFAYRWLKVELALRRASRISGSYRTTCPVQVPASKHQELWLQEQRVLAAIDDLNADLVTQPKGNGHSRPDLPAADEKRREAVLGRDDLDRYNRFWLQIIRLRFLASTDQWSRRLINPPVIVRHPLLLEPALAKMREVEIAEGNEESNAWLSSELRGLLFLRLGKREEAIGVWQAFLDAFPRSEHFADVKKKIEEALLVSKEFLDGQKLIDGCKSEAIMSFSYLFRVVGPAEGKPGLEKLIKRIEGCAKKQGALGDGWRVNAYSMAATEALNLGDCAYVAALRKKAGPTNGALFSRVQGCGCD